MNPRSSPGMTTCSGTSIFSQARDAGPPEALFLIRAFPPEIRQIAVRGDARGEEKKGQTPMVGAFNLLWSGHFPVD